MKKSKWMLTCLALGLAGIMAWTIPVLAQGRGGGPRGQGNQGYCQGQGMGPGSGQGAAYCPNYPGAQNCPRYGDNTQAPRGRRGMQQGQGRYYQPNTQSEAPAVNQ